MKPSDYQDPGIPQFFGKGLWVGDLSEMREIALHGKPRRKRKRRDFD